MFGVDDRDDAVEAKARAHFVVGEKCLGHRPRVGESRGLDENSVEFIFAFHQPSENADQIAAHRAADAAVVHFKQLLLALNNELVVDADFAEFVFDYGEFFAVLLRQNPIEQRRLTSSEKAGENRNGNRGVVGRRHKVTTNVTLAEASSDPPSLGGTSPLSGGAGDPYVSSLLAGRGTQGYSSRLEVRG